MHDHDLVTQLTERAKPRADLDILIWGGGGLYNGKSRNLMKIQAPLGGSGGMPPPPPPPGNFDIFVL